MYRVKVTASIYTSCYTTISYYALLRAYKTNQLHYGNSPYYDRAAIRYGKVLLSATVHVHISQAVVHMPLMPWILDETSRSWLGICVSNGIIVRASVVVL